MLPKKHDLLNKQLKGFQEELMKFSKEEDKSEKEGKTKGFVISMPRRIENAGGDHTKY